MSKINLNKLPFYVINLEKSTDRWNRVEASFKKEKMNKNLIEAYPKNLVLILLT